MTTATVRLTSQGIITLVLEDKRGLPIELELQLGKVEESLRRLLVAQTADPEIGKKAGPTFNMLATLDLLRQGRVASPITRVPTGLRVDPSLRLKTQRTADELGL